MTRKGLCLVLSVLVGAVACTPVEDLPAGDISAEGTGQGEIGLEETKREDDSIQLGEPESSNDSIEDQLERAIASNSSDVSNQPSASQRSSSQEDASQSDETNSQNIESSCQSEETQAALNQCAQQSYKAADAQLNQAYRSLKATLSDSAARALTTTELAWIAFRDLDCTFISDLYKKGSIEPLIHSECLRERTQTRIVELQQPDLPELSYQAADHQLNERYQTLIGQLNRPQQQEMADVQLAWIEYRDDNCAFEVLYSTNVIEETQCLARMSETRATELQGIVEQRNL